MSFLLELVSDIRDQLGHYLSTLSYPLLEAHGVSVKCHIFHFSFPIAFRVNYRFNWSKEQVHIRSHTCISKVSYFFILVFLFDLGWIIDSIKVRNKFILGHISCISKVSYFFILVFLFHLGWIIHSIKVRNKFILGWIIDSIKVRNKFILGRGGPKAFLALF